MRVLLLVDHGSRHPEANQNLAEAAEQIRGRVGAPPVYYAHMELAPPSIEDAFASCQRDGATQVSVFPWFLSHGRHVREDIPNLCANAAERYGLAHVVLPPFGQDSRLIEITLDAFDHGASPRPLASSADSFTTPE